MFYLMSFFAIVFLLMVIFSERYDFAYHNKSKRYCARTGLVAFMILQVAVYNQNELLMAIGIVPLTVCCILTVSMMVLDYKREKRFPPWFDREGL